MQLRSDTGSRIVYCLIALSTLAIGVYTPSCARSHDPEHLFDEHIENGIRIAETHGGPRFLGDLFKFEEVLQLREGDSEDAHLYRPSGFFRDKDGFFYVMDGGNNRIAVFNPEGGYVRQFGREGDGPGEFRGASLKYLHAGILNLYSLRQSRSTRFKADGTLLDVTHLPGAPSLSVLACSRLDAERAIFAKLTSTQADRIEMWVEFGVFTTTGDSVWTGRTNPCEMGMMESVEFQGISAPQPRLYQLGSTPTAVYHPSTGLVVSGGNKPELQVYNREGDLKRIIRISLERTPITDQQREWVRMQFEEQLETAPESMKPLIRESVDSLRFPASLGHWDDIIVDAEGWIWLRVPEPVKYTESLDAGREYRVLSPSGEYMGISRIPKAWRVSISGGFLMANEADLMGNNVRLVVYRMHPSPQGFEYP